MSPISERRWAQFKRNRRAFSSLWIFLVLFTISLFAEFIANDKPILIYHQAEFYFPVLVDYSEKDLGGELRSAASYWDPSIIKLIESSGGWMIRTPIPFHYQTPDMYISGPAPTLSLIHI